MKIIYASKFYYEKGGLESYLFNSKDILEESGIDVVPFSCRHEKNIESNFEKYFCDYYDLSNHKVNSIIENITSVRNMFYNPQAYKNIGQLIDDCNPSIVQGFGVTKHLSYSIFKAAKEKNIKTVFRLSDLALFCPNSIGLDGHALICEDLDCQKPINLRILKTKCIQGSSLASLVGLVESKYNSIFAGYKKYVDVWFAPSKFMMSRVHTHLGVDIENITVIPPFIDSKNIEPEFKSNGYILFAGRLENYKGLYTLLKAMKVVNKKLIVVGDGTEKNKLEEISIIENIDVKFVGHKEKSTVLGLIGGAECVVVPSECHENSPNIILEAYSKGKPVVATNIGGIPEMIVDGETGYLFELKNHEELGNKILKACSNSESMGRASRDYVEKNYNKNIHREKLLDMYSKLTVR